MNPKDEALVKFIEVVTKLSPEEFEAKYVKDNDEAERKEDEDDRACDV